MNWGYKIGCFVLLMQFLAIPLICQTQNKQDYVWLFGGPSPDQLLELDFIKHPIQLRLRTEGLDFGTNNTSISNAEGELLFYSNGCAVANRFHEIMPNGDSINSGPFFDIFWRDCQFGYPGIQDLIILPDPASLTGYYLIHKTIEYDADRDPSFFIKFLKYSYIDLELDGGNGDVTLKNEIFYEEDLMGAYLTAIQHSNKRDWWIVQPLIESNRYVFFLLNENGISFSHFEDEGTPFIDANYSNGAGRAKFSPDGLQFANFNLNDGLFLFDFDRAIGKLSNFRHLSISDSLQVQLSSLEFSPDSRFIYLAAVDTLWQVDTHEDKLDEGLELIDVWNGTQDPLNTTFDDALLAPDCKVYIRPFTGTLSMHVINKPNSKGKACDFQQQVISIPTFLDRGTFPNFPRFRVDEEVCDTSFFTAVQELSYNRFPLKLYPNPSQSVIHLNFEERMSGQIQVFDPVAQKLLTKTSVYDTDLYTLNIEAFPVGQYFIQFIPFPNPDRVFYTGSFVKVE